MQISFIIPLRFISMPLAALVKTTKNSDFEITENGFRRPLGNCWEKMVNPSEAMKSAKDYDKHVTDLKEEHSFSALKNGTPDPKDENEIFLE